MFCVAESVVVATKISFSKNFKFCIWESSDNIFYFFQGNFTRKNHFINRIIFQEKSNRLRVVHCHNRRNIYLSLVSNILQIFQNRDISTNNSVYSKFYKFSYHTLNKRKRHISIVPSVEVDKQLKTMFVHFLYNCCERFCVCDLFVFGKTTIWGNFKSKFFVPVFWRISGKKFVCSSSNQITDIFFDVFFIFPLGGKSESNYFFKHMRNISSSIYLFGNFSTKKESNRKTTDYFPELTNILGILTTKYKDMHQIYWVSMCILYSFFFKKQVFALFFPMNEYNTKNNSFYGATIRYSSGRIYPKTRK